MRVWLGASLVGEVWVCAEVKVKMAEMVLGNVAEMVLVGGLIFLVEESAMS